MVPARNKVNVGSEIFDFGASEKVLRHSQSWIGAWLMLILIPAGITLDYVVHPERFSEFATYRLIADGFVIVALLLHKTQFGRDHPSTLIGLWLGAAIIMICWMVYVSSGSTSTYYEGLVLSLLAIGILLPMRLSDALFLSLATLGLYTLSCLGPGAKTFSLTHFYNNFYFLALAAIISCVAVHFNFRRRLKAFELKKELELQNKQLEEMDRLKSNFFANVSHELRTPLTLILAPVQDLLQRVEARATELRQPLQTINTSALRLLGLVNNILDLIKLEQKNVELSFSSIDLNIMLSSLAREVQHLANKQGIDITVETGKTPLWIDGDHAAIERIFLNLLSNSIKFTPQSGKIHIKAAQARDQCVVKVTDTGQGISPVHVPKIFDRFSQSDSSATRKHQGLGLGLALVKELVEAHSGTVTAKSEQGVGTTISVTLPYAAPTYKPEEPPTASIHAISSFNRDAAISGQILNSNSQDALLNKTGGHLAQTLPKLLIVDDEPEVQTYLKSVLSRQFRVLQAFDGQRGLITAQEESPDLILLDLMLPYIDGLELCHKLKQSDNIPQSTKIIILTARIDEDAKIRALESGADDFLTKPFSSTEIVTRLTNLSKSAQLEADVRNRNIELERTLRTLKETEAQLLHSEKLSSLGTMAAGILHEINNPLNYISAALRVIRKNKTIKKDEDALDVINDIHDGFLRIQKITSDLHTFATPQVNLDKRNFVIATAISHALRFSSSAISNTSSQVICTDELTAFGNEQQIIQVLVNLILNAAKAIKHNHQEAGAKIEICAKSKNGRVEISVRDNGNGIPKEKISQVFDPFYTTANVGEGLGLGLSFSYSVIQRHGGTLVVTSEEGVGSTFSFDLPEQTSSHRITRVEVNHAKPDTQC